MLREHAHRLLGFLPKGVISGREDLDMLGDQFKGRPFKNLAFFKKLFSKFFFFFFFFFCFAAHYASRPQDPDDPW